MDDKEDGKHSNDLSRLSDNRSIEVGKFGKGGRSGNDSRRGMLYNSRTAREEIDKEDGRHCNDLRLISTNFSREAGIILREERLAKEEGRDCRDFISIKIPPMTLAANGDPESFLAICPVSDDRERTSVSSMFLVSCSSCFMYSKSSSTSSASSMASRSCHSHLLRAGF
ncbi:hypothetical protein M5K25_009912 [Dendrobium thyrsiflorum]|uniref:Uncharacterized protein n=1 Tax=Dendrobium thyrsiflorum TaxID=117978 RepID=A0ABD0V719_DENTH